MNKNEIVRNISKDCKLTQKDCKTVLDGFANLVASVLRNGDSISLLGFGKFNVKYKNARKTYNPLTKSNITIPASKVPVFKAGKTLKQAIY